MLRTINLMNAAVQNVEFRIVSKRGVLYAGGLVFVFAIPSLADAGTPLIWTSIVHLYVGNALFGFIEGCIIARLCGAPRNRCIAFMILANYVSMGAGLFIVPGLDGFFQRAWGHEAFFYAGWKLLPLYLVFSFVVTLVIEAPCAWMALRSTMYPRARKIFAFVIANVATYAILLPFYFMSSFYSFYSTLDLDPSIKQIAKRPAWVYFLSFDDTGLYRISTRDSIPERVLPSTYSLTSPWYAGLFLRENPDSSAWDLILADHKLVGNRYVMTDSVLISSIVPMDSYRYPSDQEYLYQYYSAAELKRQREESLLSPRGQAITLPPTDTPPYRVFYGNWAAEGLSIEETARNRHFSLALEVPFRMWQARFPAGFPENRLVYQLGEYIVLVDLDQMKVAYLARGFSPFVILQNFPQRAAGS